MGVGVEGVRGVWGGGWEIKGVRGPADLSSNIPPEIFGRSLGYRRIAISKFSKKSQKWRLFVHLGAKMH